MEVFLRNLEPEAIPRENNSLHMFLVFWPEAIKGLSTFVAYTSGAATADMIPRDNTDSRSLQVGASLCPAHKS